MSLVIVLFGHEEMNIYLFIFFATMVVVGKAWMTPTIESLMIVQMKLDKRRGAEDLETFGMMC
jgi:MFS family permease